VRALGAAAEAAAAHPPQLSTRGWLSRGVLFLALLQLRPPAPTAAPPPRPQDCFKATNFGNTTVRALMPREVDGEGKQTGRVISDDAARLLGWQEAAFDALELGYLRCIIFGIYSAEEDPSARELLESYVYHFKYPSAGEIELTLEKDAKSFTSSSVRDQAVGMVRTLIRLCETMKPVPEERVISLKLFYYDDATPVDYQPQFFSDATNGAWAYRRVCARTRVVCALFARTLPHHPRFHQFLPSQLAGHITKTNLLAARSLAA